MLTSETVEGRFLVMRNLLTHFATLTVYLAVGVMFTLALIGECP